MPCDTGDIFAYGGDEFTVLLHEFKVQIAEYLGTLSHTSMRTLADLIAFNIAHCAVEMPYFGQEVFEWSNATSGGLTDPAYLAARANCLLMSRQQGIDAVLGAGVDAIVAPSYTLATQPAAVAGYPNLAIPCGFTADGRRPACGCTRASCRSRSSWRLRTRSSRRCSRERVRRTLGTLQPFPPDPGVCAALPGTGHGRGRQGYRYAAGRLMRTR